MNKKIITIAIALALPITVTAFPGGEGGRSEGNRGNRIERLAEKLDLNADQKTKMQAIFKQQREKINAIREETRVHMQDVLSPEQMEKFDQIKKQHKQNRQEKRKNKQQNKMQNQPFL